MAETVKVRIRVAVWPDGSYTAYGGNEPEVLVVGSHGDLLEGSPEGERIVWVEAEVPLTEVISAAVVS